ncbi:MAG: hypothetical protein E6R08_11045 [Nevskiaceae bacterium]|nr:MAG: hypothetical protein E6R08_11045 [Nevskiaceae bacterium]
MIALAFDGDKLTGDLQVGSAGLVQDDDLTSCVLISLFTDRRARADDPLPAGAGDDRRGWLGDALATVEGDRIGSRLWLLKREKQTEETRRRAIEYCREALAWMITDGLARQIDFDAEWLNSDGLLGVPITIYRPDGTIFRQSVTVATGAA